MAGSNRSAAASAGKAALAIGPIRLPQPMIQAALSGYSDWPMRVIARRLGAPMTLCEVMLDKFLLAIKPERRKNRRFLYLTDDEHPVGAQLMGAEPPELAAAARRLVQAGFDLIDINFGCPVKKVLGRCRGGYLLGQPQTALEIVRRVREAVPARIPVTVKLRSGLDGSAQSRDRFFQILEGALAEGVAAVTVHGRTVQQRYEGRADWTIIAEAKRAAGRGVVLGSGDLLSAPACVRMLNETRVDGVAIARGAIGNPWIFKQVGELLAGRPLPPPPPLDEQRQVILEHVRLAEQLYGERQAAMVMRKFGARYAQLHPQCEQVRNELVRANSPAEWEAVLQRWYVGRESWARGDSGQAAAGPAPRP